MTVCCCSTDRVAFPTAPGLRIVDTVRKMQVGKPPLHAPCLSLLCSERSTPLGFARGRCPRRVRQHITAVSPLSGAETWLQMLKQRARSLQWPDNAVWDVWDMTRLSEGQSHGRCTNLAHTCGARQTQSIPVTDRLYLGRQVAQQTSPSGWRVGLCQTPHLVLCVLRRSDQIMNLKEPLAISQ